MELSSLTSLVLAEAPLVTYHCPYCNTDHKSSLTANGNFVVLEFGAIPIGKTRLQDKFHKDISKLFFAYPPEALHLHTNQ